MDLYQNIYLNVLLCIFALRVTLQRRQPTASNQIKLIWYQRMDSMHNYFEDTLLLLWTP